MEHCVFCAFLSTGKDYRDCGRPCDTHRVAPARPRRRRASAQGRRRLPQHRFQQPRPDRRRVRRAPARARRAQFPRRVPQRGRRRGPPHRGALPAAPARRNHRRRSLARAQAHQPARRHPRPDGNRPAGEPFICIPPCMDPTNGKPTPPSPARRPGNQGRADHLRAHLGRPRGAFRPRAPALPQGDHPPRRRARRRQGHQHRLHRQDPRPHLRAHRDELAARHARR